MPHPTGPACRAWRAAAILAGVALLAACGGGEEKASDPAAEDYARELPAGFEALPASARIDFPQNPRAECNAITTRIVFRSAFEWESFWQGNAPECPVPSAGAIDWNRDMLAFVTLGERKAAEDRVTLVGKRETADSLILM
ncbi:MAG TPA: hypothetical protein VFQ39_04335, partial [Longimicrobium sp.]|nr:hypothetical protein [Longimicrobium sp.]